MHCSEPVAWRGSWRAPNGRHYRVEACEGQVVPAGTEVQVHPAALPLDFIKLAFAVVLTAGLEREQLRVSQKALQFGEHLVLSSTQSSEPSAISEAPCRSCRGSMASSMRDLPLPGRVRSRGRMPT
jgi:hypothetical protein